MKLHNIFINFSYAMSGVVILADEPTGNLDSKTREEVMALFRELNDTGQTVVMVTHHPENCAYSDRTINLKDGMVVSA